MNEPKGPRFDFSTKEGNLQRHKENEQKLTEEKATILANLQAIVQEEKAKDPEFNISRKFIEAKMRAQPNLFPGVRKYSAFITRFGSSINFLRTKLGLPEIKTKGEGYF